MTDKTPGACQCHEKHVPTYWKGVVREYKGALEKAGKERDEALFRAERAHENVRAREEMISRLDARARKGERERDDARATVEEQAALIEHLRADASRPLTPDAITDEMVERVQQWAVGLRIGGIVYLGTKRAVREMFDVALTGPPARPEGAYELEVVIGLNAGKWTNGAEDVRALADLLASNGVRAKGGE